MQTEHSFQYGPESIANLRKTMSWFKVYSISEQAAENEHI